MPFTLAHPAILLPLAPAARRVGLPFAALVAGSMAPDVPLFVPWVGRYGLTHTPAGILTIDVAIGMALWLLWILLMRAPVTDAMPDRVRRRLPVPGPGREALGMRPVLLAVGAVAVGAASHVGWDEFTHAGRWGSAHIAWLAQHHGRLPGTAWAQQASGILGLGILLVALVVTWRRSAPRVHPRTRRFAWGTLVVPAVAAGAVALSVVARGVMGGATLHTMAYVIATEGIPIAAVTALLCAAAWHLTPASAGVGLR